MPKSTYVDKATSICYNCQGKGHFASECRSKKDKFSRSTSTSSSSSRDAKYHDRGLIAEDEKGRGLITEDHDKADLSDDSSDEEDNTGSPCLMALKGE